MVGNVLEYEEMNDILAKLYIQAAEMAVKEEPTDLIAGQIVQMQKFAELIVRECAEHAITFNNNLQSLNDKEIRSHAHRIGDYIKDRLGVEL
jgi:hypothetical protein